MKVRRRTDRLYEAIIGRVIPASLAGERLGAAASQTDLNVSFSFYFCSEEDVREAVKRKDRDMLIQ